MEVAQALTYWYLDEADGVNKTALQAFGVSSAKDINQQPGANIPPDPNQCVWEIIAEPAVMDAIAADDGLLILTGTRKPTSFFNDAPGANTVPTPAEYAQWRTTVLDLINPATGQPTWTVGQFNQAVGPLPADRKWKEINAELLEFLRTAPGA